MPQPVHVYSPDQYATVVDLWQRLLDATGNDQYSDEELYMLILTDGEIDWSTADKRVSLCYSSDYSGSEIDRANARTLAKEFGNFLVHVDNSGAWSESYVELTIGELPAENTEEGISELQRFIETVESLSDYPVLDDTELYELEAEIEEESWNSWFLSDFASAVADNLGCEVYELEEDFKVSDDRLREMFYDVRSKHWDLSFRVENATSGHFEGWEDIIAPEVAELIVAEWRAVLVDPNQPTLI